MTRFGRALAALCLVAAGASAAPTPEAEGARIDHVVVRFVARETGGVEAPRYVTERQLAFEARLEALAEGEAREGEPAFRSRHVRAALERHIAETVLESLDVEPAVTEADVKARVEDARLSLIERVGGLVALKEAAQAEGIGEGEVFRILRRKALASLYLDRMVAPMLEPTEAELRNVHRTQRTPFSGRPFEQVSSELRRWVVGGRLGASLASYYEGLQSRLQVTILR